MSASVVTLVPSSTASIATVPGATAPVWWPLLEAGANFAELSPAACWKLLAGEGTGWLSWPPADLGPRLPTRYTVTPTELLLTPATDNIVRNGGLVLLQVDRFDATERAGWSVVVVGRSLVPSASASPGRAARGHLAVPLAWAGVVGRTLTPIRPGPPDHAQSTGPSPTGRAGPSSCRAKV